MKIETQFNVGDIAWLIFNNEPKKTEIKQINVIVATDGELKEPVVKELYTHGYPPNTMLYKSIDDLTKDVQLKAEAIKEVPIIETPVPNDKNGI